MKTLPKIKHPKLSVVILNYNGGKYLSSCLMSIDSSDLKNNIEIIIGDNHSTDGSFTDCQHLNLHNPHIQYIFHKNTGNVGFSAGNNQALSVSNQQSNYVIFLNPDTTVETNTLQGMIDYFDTHEFIPAATCYITLVATNQLQPECHRGFPTPWNTFWHFFGLGIPRLFPHSKIFNGYFMAHLDYSRLQKIDCCVGAFIMFRRNVGNKIGWWNEIYFMYGEDLDICYQLRKNGFQLYFIPDYKISHFQGAASGIKKTRSLANRETKVRSAKATTNAMRIFYKENLIHDYPKILHPIIYLGISVLDIYRLFKAKYL